MSKIQFTIVCDETGKKYKISFKENMYNFVTIKHIREHVRKAQTNPLPFELYYNGELLLDPMFCYQQDIGNNSVVLMKLIPSPQLLNSQFANRKPVYPEPVRLQPEQQQQIPCVQPENLPEQHASGHQQQDYTGYEDQDDYYEISESYGTHGQHQYVQQFVTPQANVDAYAPGHMADVRRAAGPGTRGPVPNDSASNEQNEPQVSQINILRSHSNIEHRNPVDRKPAQYREEVNNNEASVRQLSVSKKRAARPKKTQMASQHAEGDNQMLLSKQIVNNIFSSSAKQDALPPDGNDATSSSSSADQLQDKLFKQTVVNNAENEKIKLLETQVQLLQQKLQDSEATMNRLVKQQVQEVLQQQKGERSVSSNNYDHSVLISDITARQEQLMNLQQQLISNPFNTKLNNDISNIQTPILPSFGQKTIQTPQELNNQAIINNTAPRSAGRQAEPSTSGPDNEIDLDTYQEPEAAKTQHLNAELLEEVENYEKVVILLENQQEILQADKTNQHHINQQLINQLQQYEQMKLDRQYAMQYNYSKFNFLTAQIASMQGRLQYFSEQRRKMHNQVEDLKGNIRVFVRVRPQTPSEKAENPNFHRMLRVVDGQTIKLAQQSDGVGTQYKFYRVFDQQANQQQIFNDVKPLIKSALDGYNVFIGGYGNTGSGKTFTILGDDGTSQTSDSNQYGRLGLLPRTVVELFKNLQQSSQQFQVQLSMVELYCDQLIDLLEEEDSMAQDTENATPLGNSRQKLEIRKDQSKNETYVKNLTYFSTRQADDVIVKLGQGLAKRHVSETLMNDRSSRSHTIIYLRVIQQICQSTIIFADLAGSERIDKSQSSGQRQREAQFINTSLSALGDVICALSQKKQFVPYRNNKLTQLLQPGMGGNSKALLFICVSPLERSIQESFCSLQFGIRAKSVQNVSTKSLYE